MMIEENERALVALLATARHHYVGNESFDLSRREVVALVRGIVAAHPDVTPAALVRLAGKAGVPASVLARIGRGEPAAGPQRKPTTTWSARTRLAHGGGGGT